MSHDHRIDAVPIHGPLAEGDLGGNLPPVLPADGDRDRPSGRRIAGGQPQSDATTERLAQRLRHEHGDRLTDQLVGAIAEQPLPRGIEQQHDPRLVDGDDGIGSRLGQGAIEMPVVVRSGRGCHTRRTVVGGGWWMMGDS